MDELDSRDHLPRTRRAFLAGTATVGTVGFAGCAGILGGDDETPTDPPESTETTAEGEPDLIGSRREGRGLPGGTPMEDLPDLSGELLVYSGRGEFLVGELMDAIRERYPEFGLEVRYSGATDLANQIRTEGDASPADVFFTVNAGILGLLASDGRLQSLPDSVLSMGREGFQDPDGTWIGTSGRVRTVPYNTDELSEDDVPDSILDFPDQDAFENRIGWATSYGSFHGFVTVMRILNGEETTREWLRGMQELGVQTYQDEFQVAQAVAEGDLVAGLTNHYYVVRVQEGRSNASIDMTFTESDAGSFFNVAGAGVVDTADDAQLAANFVRHLLSAEAQDYFARSATFEYPMVPEVEPIAELPGFDELNPPDLDLAEFASADVTETIDLMESVGVL